MKKRLTHISPLQAGIVLGLLYGLVGLIFSVVYLIASVFGKVSDRDFVIVLILPIIYAVVGLVGGIIAAAIYNLVARWTGGLEFELGDVPPDA